MIELKKGLFIIAALALLLTACAGDDVAGGASGDAGVVAVTDREVAGVSQKGPFVTGSAVTVQELDGITLKQTGKSFKGTIKSDKGDFAIKDINLQSQYAILEASGYYRDEISGKKSSGTVTLRALTDLSNRKTVNINLLTHLEYERVMYLVTEKKKSIAEAKEQAEKEILASFGIDGDFAESEDLNIFESGDGNAALLAVSVLMQSDVDVAGLTESMGEFSIALAEGGSWDDADTKTAIADWACDVDLKGTLANIRRNVENWKYADSVPAFEKYVTNFWWNNYGLGVCNAKRENETKRNINKLSKLYDKYFVCEKGRWHIPDDEPESNSSKDCSSSSVKVPEPAEGSSSSSTNVSSSSLYNPFNSSSSQNPLLVFPSDLGFLDAFCSLSGPQIFAEGKQRVWTCESWVNFYDTEQRDSAASALVDTLGVKGFAFDGTVPTDSLSSIYDSLAYVYSVKKGDVVYKFAITKYVTGFPFPWYMYDVKVVVMEAGFEEIPTTDYSSLRYATELPEELGFMQEYLSSKSRMHWNDDSLMTVWYGRYVTSSVKKEKNDNVYIPEVSEETVAAEKLEIFKDVLLKNGFVYLKSDTVSQDEFNRVENFQERFFPSAYTSDSLVRRSFYEMETSVAKYKVTVYVAVNFSEELITYIRTYSNGYSVEILTYYKQKPERKKS
jgi:hypothetical protein